MIRIISDSTCDLSPELVERYHITVVPLHVLLGEAEYLDGKNITPDEIYTWADENKTTPKTSAVGMDDTQEYFKSIMAEDDCDGIVAFSISASMSTTNNVFRLAADELGISDRVRVIDSANLSTGVGHLVVEAAVLAQKGADLDEIEQAILEYRPRVRASFVIDTLVYLHRGGRCSGMAALAGGMLKLHPKIVVKDGAMLVDKKYRGKLAPVTLNYAKDMEADLLNAKKDRVFITHSGTDPEIVESVRSYLESLNHFDEILETRAGSVVSSHCGPGTLGVLFILNE